MGTILSVIGPHSGCGKTTFVIHLLRRVPGLGCLKVSPAHEWSDATIEGAEAVGQNFFLEGSASLNRSGKDTARYIEAGAAQVRRLRHRAAGLATGLQVALGRFPAGMPVVVESSSAVALLKPVAVILVVRPPLREMKPATESILARVTDLMINASNHEGLATGEGDRLLEAFPSLAPQFTWFADLLREPPSAEMLARLRALLTPHDGHQEVLPG
jgi:hypothetical protein